MKQFNAIILFADLVSSSRMSDILSPKNYLMILDEFERAGHRICHQLSMKLQPLGVFVKFCEGGIRGEEIQIIVGFNEFDETITNLVETTNRRLVIMSVIEAALELSLGWFIFADANRSKHREFATPSRIGIGLHYGKLYPFRSRDGRWRRTRWVVAPKTTQLHLGSAMNFGKRVEAASRLSRGIGISISESFFALCVEHGVPLICGEQLESEPKGFEYPQPIFDLKQQYVLQSSDALTDNPEGIHLLYDTLHHNPNRVEIFYSLAIESIIAEASERKDMDLFTQAVNYSQYPIGVLDSPEYFHWLKAISLYRRATLQDGFLKKQDMDEAILHYERASQKLAWAYLDLAAAYLYRPTLGNEKIGDLKHARYLLTQLTQKDPLLFHAYNVRALVIAKLSEQIDGKRGVRRESLLDLASADLSIARGLNEQPKYMYLGTEATIEKARAKLNPGDAARSRERVFNLTDAAKAELQKAIEDNQRLRGISEDRIPAYHFWRPGFTDPPYHPPRPTSLRNAWSKLREEN